MAPGLVQRAYARMLLRIYPTLDGCWEWQGACSRNGYGNIHICKEDGRKIVMATHRVSFVVNHRPLLDDEEVRHKCDNRPCWHPDHLEPGPKLANLHDIITRQRDSSGRIARMVASMEANSCPF